MALAPDTKVSIGLKIGRRSADLVLMDFCGAVRMTRQTTHRYPMPGPILTLLRDGIDGFRQGLGSGSRIAGIGVAQPFEIWNWHDTIGASTEELEAWRGLDIAAAIAEFSDLPVHVQNEATAACRAEHVYGCGSECRDFAYFFVGAFIGGGVVLNHSVFDGLHGNAGAFGALPARDAEGRDCQLIDVAALYLLEARLTAAGIAPERLWTRPRDWSPFAGPAGDWIAAAAPQVTRAALTICAVVDFEAVVVDGTFLPEARDRFVARIAEEVAVLDARGIRVPRIVAGRIGGNARRLGAACPPVFDR